MRTCLLFLALVALLSCDNGDSAPNEKLAISKACAKCDLTVTEMNWLAVKINESKTSVEKSGSLYAISTSQGVIIVHQLLIMSCMGCQRYDCHGNTPTLTEQVVMNELVPGMNASNVIFENRF
jgi:hypothetical protein